MGHSSLCVDLFGKYQFTHKGTCYPLSKEKIIVYRGHEFLAEFREMITNDYSITVKPIKFRILQANSIY